jgi:hypothetical protein
MHDSLAFSVSTARLPRNSRHFRVAFNFKHVTCRMVIIGDIESTWHRSVCGDLAHGERYRAHKRAYWRYRLSQATVSREFAVARHTLVSDSRNGIKSVESREMGRYQCYRF